MFLSGSKLLYAILKDAFLPSFYFSSVSFCLNNECQNKLRKAFFNYVVFEVRMYRASQLRRRDMQILFTYMKRAERTLAQKLLETGSNLVTMTTCCHIWQFWDNKHCHTPFFCLIVDESSRESSPKKCRPISLSIEDEKPLPMIKESTEVSSPLKQGKIAQNGKTKIDSPRNGIYRKKDESDDDNLYKFPSTKVGIKNNGYLVAETNLSVNMNPNLDCLASGSVPPSGQVTPATGKPQHFNSLLLSTCNCLSASRASRFFGHTCVVS